MPTYDYRCGACEHLFEEFQSFSEKPLKKCPQCKKPKLQRLIGAGAAILFKGSGFYQTDYRSESYKSAAKAAAQAEESKSSAAKDSSTNAGSAAKAESKGASSAAGTNQAKSAKSRD